MRTVRGDQPPSKTATNHERAKRLARECNGRNAIAQRFGSRTGRRGAIRQQRNVDSVIEFARALGLAQIDPRREIFAESSDEASDIGAASHVAPAQHEFRIG